MLAPKCTLSTVNQELCGLSLRRRSWTGVDCCSVMRRIHNRENVLQECGVTAVEHHITAVRKTCEKDATFPLILLLL